MILKLKNILFFLHLLLVSLLVNAQDYLPELPSCSDVDLHQDINIDNVLTELNNGNIVEPLGVFCYLKRQSEIMNTEGEEIAVIVSEFGDGLSQIAKYDEASYFYSLSAQLWRTSNKPNELALTIRKIGENYSSKGETINAIKYLNIALKQSETINDIENKYQTLIALTWIERWTHSFEKVDEYLVQIKHLLEKDSIDNKYKYFSLLHSINRAKNNFKLSETYIDSTIFIAKKHNDSVLLALSYSNKANIMMHRKSDDKKGIINKLLFALAINKENHNTIQLSSNYGVLGKAYIYNHEYDKAIETINKGLKYALETKNKGEIMLKYWYLQQAYKGKKDYKNAYEYMHKHHMMYGDYYGPNRIQTINNVQRKNEQKLHKIELANIEQEKELISIKNKKHKRTFWLTSIIGLLIFSSLLYFFISQKNKQKRENEIEQERLAHELLEMEMQALRARMNPHFLFNSLNSIKSFIATNQPREASNYLTKFSVLVRMMLNHSKEKLISLEENVKALRYYLDIEQMRLKDKFTYVFNIDEELNLNRLFIPPAIVQPYIENAIWHGVASLEKQGEIKINIYKKNKDVFIEIKDNGIGREKTATISKKPNHRSAGTNIIKKTLEVFKKDGIIDIRTKTIDLYNSENKPTGTKVVIQIKAQKK